MTCLSEHILDISMSVCAEVVDVISFYSGNIKIRLYSNGVMKTTSLNHERILLPSSTEGSTKHFEITVDDSGTISVTEGNQYIS